MKFDIPQELNSIIKVIGVGGGGGNAVNHMYQQGIRGVDFIVCNTDRQALDVSPVPVKVQLGVALTAGLGAGAVPERGREAVLENLDELRQLLSTGTKMVFITAGMGGGTGTGAAPVIAQLARELGILTVGIVTSPFHWEGRRRKSQAVTGEEELRNAVDTLLVINNDRLRDLFGNLSVNNAFEHADNVLTTAARGIAEIITKTGKVNVDFEDVKTVMTRSGNAIMGMAEAEGEDRALRAAREALDSPLLNDSNIAGAKFVLLNITYGTREILMDEIGEITDHIQQAAGSGADVIWGYGMEESLGDKVRITVIATGFETGEASGAVPRNAAERTVIPLDADRPTMITQPIVNPVAVPVAMPPVHEVPTEPYIKQATEEARPVETSSTLAPQATIEFEVDPVHPKSEPLATTPEPEKIVHTLGLGADVTLDNGTLVSEARMSPMEHQLRVEERQARMRAISQQLRSPGGLADMEHVPAYKRKNIHISDAQYSADSNVSRYTLNEEVDEHGERRVELKRNNPFLHDNVD
jgi:cell division protein FtsZ